MRCNASRHSSREMTTLHAGFRLSAAYGVHPTVIAHWKRQLLDGAPEVFRRGLAGTGRSEEVVTAPLYQEIGRLKMELEWLKKKL